MSESHDPQDVAEQLDEDVTSRAPDADPGSPEQHGLFDVAPDEPVAVEEELVTEPIVDSVASRDERLQPETIDEIEGPSALGSSLESSLDGPTDVVADVGDLAADSSDLAPEEAALHVIDDANLG